VVHHADALLREHGDVAIGEEKDFSRVLQQGGDIAGHEKFAIAEADDRRGAHARRHDLVRIFRGHEHQGINAAQLFQRAAYCFLERRIFGMFLDQVRDDFRVCFRSELMSFALQLLLQLQIIFDDAVVHHDDLPGAVAMRMRVLFGGAAMRRPAGVADSVSAFDGRFLQGFFEIAQFPGRAANFQFAVLRYDGDSRRIIAAIFQFAQAFNDDRNDLLRPDITDNSAHTGFLLREAGLESVTRSFRT